jgi:hypothetical protein
MQPGQLPKLMRNNLEIVARLFTNEQASTDYNDK